MRYNVYVVSSKMNYCGSFLVAASSVQEANAHIKAFIESDENNVCDSWGYYYVDETDIVDDVYSEREGILHYGIHYSG